MMQAKIGTRGEIVIPKKIRDHLELNAGKEVTLRVHDGSVEISPKKTGVVQKMRERAKRYDYKADDLVVGDELYEEGL